ncbi:putative HTH CENPB-type domain-containing protein [Phytophthora infestans]|uniref:Putative HTH CENPB-type domain-containing protein n=1 Tax=Phytophthora infestans TaxID=4787 RepID=A0A833T5S0_PHYIN|nr:putative HTH CENPB-type domain-containing protein [Phytophthora infestans]KAF4037307.1 putative HTH CENPB-type domain-containing protein [Phytophthora infestans]
MHFALIKHPVQGTISAILKDSDRYLNVRDEDQHVRRSRSLNFPKLDETLANWVLQCQARQIMLDGNMVKAKGPPSGEDGGGGRPAHSILKRMATVITEQTRV